MIKKAKWSGKKAKAFARAASNPFEAGSAYAACYDVLAAHPQGIKGPELVGHLARLTGKDAMQAYFDMSVVTSVSKDGRSNRNVKQAAGVYYVERLEGGAFRLVVRDGKAGNAE